MMDDNAPAAQDAPQQPPKWKPLPSIYRRVAGVLIEKAKTTPDAYPLSLNALTNGCNQKSNRSPQMHLDADQVEDAVDRLRHLDAASEIQGGGRVPKYRHYMKEWLGVDGNELAVMAELLLRGPQTIGELRGRAARMANIPDVSALRPIVQSLQDRGLVIALTPAGRGQVVTHALYEEREMEKLRQQYGSQATDAPAAAPSAAPVARPAPVESEPPTRPVAPTPPPTPTAVTSSADDAGAIAELRKELSQLRSEVDRLRQDVNDLWENLR